MHDRRNSWLTILNQKSMRTLIAALVTVSFAAAGCDKVEGLVEDGKSLVNGEEPAVADTPALVDPVAPPAITTPEPVVPAGPAKSLTAVWLNSHRHQKPQRRSPKSIWGALKFP